MLKVAFIVPKKNKSQRICCFYLVCGVAVPDDEFAILGSADQKPGEKERNNYGTEQLIFSSPYKYENKFWEMWLITLRFIYIYDIYQTEKYDDFSKAGHKLQCLLSCTYCTAGSNTNAQELQFLHCC